MKPGGLLIYLLMCPIMIWAGLFALTAAFLLIYSGDYAALGGQIAIAVACGQKSTIGGTVGAPAGDLLGRSGTTLAGAITAALFFQGASAYAITGSSIWFAMTWINWGHRFGYSPAWWRFVIRNNMGSYFAKAELRSQTGTKAKETMRTSKTLYCFHPHGMTCAGYAANGIWAKEFNERATPKPLPKDWEAKAWPGTMFFIAAGLREPSHLFKMLCDASGRVESASRENIKKRFKEGRNVGIIPGGFEEATIYEHGKHRVAMRRRKGLIKYALQHGYALVPIYTFGENRTYYTISGWVRLRQIINSFQMPAVAFWGAWFLPVLPRYDAEVLTYVGLPVQLPKIEEPTGDEVDMWLEKYLDALRTLFDESKAEAGEPNAVLEVWSEQGVGEVKTTTNGNGKSAAPRSKSPARRKA